MNNSTVHIISSYTAQNGSTSSFDHFMYIPSNHNAISLVSCSIPKSYYTIPSTAENSFYLDAVKFSVPVGNYSATFFVNTVSALISPATIAFNSSTGKMTITGTYSHIIFPAGSRINQLFGFAEGSTNSFSGGSITSDRVCVFQSINTIYILANCVLDKSFTYGNCLMSLPISTVPDFSFYTYINPCIEETRKHLIKPITSIGQNTQDINQVLVHFTLIDEEGQVIDLNNVDWSLSVRTWEQKDLYRLMKNYVELQVAKENYKMSKEK